MAQEYYKPMELAKHWNCSRTMIQKLISQKKLVAFKLGRTYRISAKSVEEFEQTNEINPVQPWHTGHLVTQIN